MSDRSELLQIKFRMQKKQENSDENIRRQPPFRYMYIFELKFPKFPLAHLTYFAAQLSSSLLEKRN